MANRADLTNCRFGNWLVIGFDHSNGGNSHWVCCCACGTGRSVLGKSLTSGASQSCGCQKGKGHVRHGKTGTRTHRIWIHMRQRCNNPANTHYAYYGERGIKVCNRWNTSFEAFLADMGECPDGMTIERKDGNRGYSPENCKWADRVEQQNNTSYNKILTFHGKSQTMAQWSDDLNIPYSTLRYRTLAKWPLEKALTQPSQRPQDNGMTAAVRRAFTAKQKQDRRIS